MNHVEHFVIESFGGPHLDPEFRRFALSCVRSQPRLRVAWRWPRLNIESDGTWNRDISFGRVLDCFLNWPIAGSQAE